MTLLSMVDIVTIAQRLRDAVAKKQTQSLRNVVTPLHAAFHGSNAKVRLDVTVAKIKVEKLQKEKEEKEKLKKEKK